MSDTPRTDAEEKGASYFTGVEMRQAWNLARQLEREIADAQQRLREWRDLCEKADRENAELSDQVMRWFKAASPYATPGSLEQGLKKLKRELAEALNVERCYQELFNGPSDAPTLPKEYMGEYERMEEYRLQKEKPSNEVLAAIVYGRETGYALALRDAAEIAEHYAKLMNSEAAQRAADEIRAMLSESNQ